LNFGALVKHCLAGIAVLALPALAAAQPALPAAPTAVAGVTVSPAVKCLAPRRPADPGVPAPKVVSSFPAPGSMVRPGKLIVRITFDLPMACGGTFLDASPLMAPFAGGDRVVKLTLDRKTFRIEGYVGKNSRYGLWLNHGPVRDFMGLSGQPLEAYGLTFSTSGGPAVTTVAEALAEDKP
jgi:hypothetical protein